MVDKTDRVLSMDWASLAILTAERIMRSHNYKWTMRNGEMIDIKDMDDKHLNNTIALIKRQLEDHRIVMECGATEEDLY